MALVFLDHLNLLRNVRGRAQLPVIQLALDLLHHFTGAAAGGGGGGGGGGGAVSNVISCFFGKASVKISGSKTMTPRNTNSRMNETMVVVPAWS